MATTENSPSAYEILLTHAGKMYTKKRPINQQSSTSPNDLKPPTLRIHLDKTTSLTAVLKAITRTHATGPVELSMAKYPEFNNFVMSTVGPNDHLKIASGTGSEVEVKVRDGGVVSFETLPGQSLSIVYGGSGLAMEQVDEDTPCMIRCVPSSMSGCVVSGGKIPGLIYYRGGDPTDISFETPGDEKVTFEVVAVAD